MIRITASFLARYYLGIAATNSTDAVQVGMCGAKTLLLIFKRYSAIMHPTCGTANGITITNRCLNFD